MWRRITETAGGNNLIVVAFGNILAIKLFDSYHASLLHTIIPMRFLLHTILPIRFYGKALFITRILSRNLDQRIPELRSE